MKKYVLLMMLLIGLLVPMTIASKSIDSNVNDKTFYDQELFDVLFVSESMRTGKTKFMITKEGAEGIQNRRYIGSKVDIYISTDPPSSTLCPNFAKKEEQLHQVVRYQSDSVKELEIDIMEKLPQEDTFIHIANSIYSGSGISSNEITNYIRYL